MMPRIYGEVALVSGLSTAILLHPSACFALVQHQQLLLAIYTRYATLDIALMLVRTAAPLSTC